MGLSNLLFFILTSLSFGKSQLPELATKQTIENIRFLSRDGKYTLYQQNSGSLYLSTNYKVYELIKGVQNSNYSVIGSMARENLLIEQDQSFQRNYSLIKENKIFILKKGENRAIEIGSGRWAKLHLEDKWVSFLKPYEKTITFKQINSGLEFKIKLNYQLNPFFIPEVVMINDNEILYTDLNKDGHSGIIKYNRSQNKFTVFLKVPDINRKIELCRNKDQIFVAEYGLNHSSQKSIIYQIPMNKLDMGNASIIYESQHNDPGNLICDYTEDSIYFVKNLEKERQRTSYEVVKLQLKDKSYKILSDVIFASHFINMDGNLLLPYLGVYYVLEGSSDLKKFDLLKKDNPDSEVKK